MVSLFEFGFYPVASVSDRYFLGSPAIKTAVLKFENGKTLTIEATNQSDENVYVERVSLNGKLNRHYITHAEIMNDGKLKFAMNDTPKNLEII